ncbi:hypothetical protein HRI_000302300 [Hibiscus trionum]|uniref:DUF4283 domain-containing protein n=1 Tax=Hibiscus trionum TaxID=183268 RepID=A0A9W7GVF2_HIBTR|nr:hypothetical protein HRI_000302300 [Hibiscus trionum]
MIGIFDDSASMPRNPKKHRRLDDDPPDGEGADPGRGTAAPSVPSYKDFLVQNSTHLLSESDEIMDEEEIPMEEGDVVRSEVDGMIAIDFSDRIISLAEKSFEQTVVVKLLRRRIGYTTLRNKIYELWKPSQPIKLMDIDNDYFFVSFRTKSDYQRILSQGPWTVFGHYFNVQPWTPLFSTSTAYPSQVMA